MAYTSAKADVNCEQWPPLGILTFPLLRPAPSRSSLALGAGWRLGVQAGIILFTWGES